MTKRQNVLAFGLALALIAPLALAAATAEDAARLKTTLTPFGAEKAGNKDGSIPAWDGGYTKAPAGYKNGTPRPDPFADEKPLFSITAKNYEQYADKLTDGSKALFKKYPDYRIDVYPTHRTAAAPQWVYDNTQKNATRAKLSEDGRGVTGAYGGIPFPIPANGNEAIWNHRLSWYGQHIEYTLRTFVVTGDGRQSLASEGEEMIQYPYYLPDGSAEKFSGYYQLGRFLISGPPSKTGQAILVHEPMNPGTSRDIWQYLVGQRRVRKAPSVAYDTPDDVTSGIGLFDEAFMMFGPVDRYEFKLGAKKEVFIPYNNNRSALAKVDDIMGKNFLNPDKVRWELHRVWEVDATLSAGKRHVVPKRKYYLDEDTWQVVLFDGWDAKGELWRTNYSLTYLLPDMPGLVTNVMWGGYDLQTGAYYFNAAMNGGKVHYRIGAPVSEGLFSPEELASQSAR